MVHCDRAGLAMFRDGLVQCLGDRASRATLSRDLCRNPDHLHTQRTAPHRTAAPLIASELDLNVRQLIGDSWTGLSGRIH